MSALSGSIAYVRNPALLPAIRARGPEGPPFAFVTTPVSGGAYILSTINVPQARATVPMPYGAVGPNPPNQFPTATGSGCGIDLPIQDPDKMVQPWGA